MGQVSFLSPRIGRDWVVTAWTRQARTLLDLAQLYGVPLPADCSAGECGRCAVKVAPLSNPTAVRMGIWERRTLLAAGKLSPEEAVKEVLRWRGPRWRLACQCVLGEADQFLVAF